MVALGGLVFTVISAGRHAGSTAVVSALVTVLALAVALASSARSEHPVLPQDLLRRKDFLSPNVVALTMNLIFNGLLFVGMLYLQEVRHYSPIAAGIAVLPMAIPLVVLAPVSGRITAARGPRTAIGRGCVVSAAGSLLLAGFLLVGCGGGLITASVVAAVVRATPPDRSGLATGTSNTARQIGTACGVAVFGAVAGSPADAHFVDGVHLLAVAAAVAWTGALALTGIGIPGRSRD